jgi:NADH:ubiquinone oxidoreductase subunit E
VGKQEKNAVHTISVCAGSKCEENNSKKLRKRLKEIVEERNWGSRIHIEKCGCLKACKNGPAVMVTPGNRLVENVKPKRALELLESLPAIDRK